MSAPQNEFTWQQRGAIDYLIGVSPGHCDAPTFEEREAWEEGYHAQCDRHIDLLVRVTGQTRESVLASLRARP